MIVNTRLDKRQSEIANLITYASNAGAIGWGMADGEMETLLDLHEQAEAGTLTEDQLRHLTLLVQKTVRLPHYTVRQAAAWLGFSEDGVRLAIRTNRLQAVKPGHDLVISHEALAGLAERRRYPLMLEDL